MNGRVTVEVGDNTYEGDYQVVGSLVTVRTSFGSKSTQKGGLPAATVARHLLADLVRRERARPDSVL